MRFPDSFLDDIRERLRISEVVGTRVSFDKKKSNPARGDFWACCPFHGEKTPSFHCEDQKGRYHCFGCGVSGDHFRFVTELDGLSFPEAVERLADQAGIPMPVMDRREQEREEKRASLYDVMEMATAFFEQQLHTAEGAKARAYLRDRGLSTAIQQEFRIGFAPDSRNALKEFLASKGVEQKQVEACGLVVHGEDIAVSYDRFRDRIMFPIPDSRGRMIAFGGRALKADAMAKYLNSPETELFHKSNVLFNFAKARKPAFEQKQVIAAEGYMDVIALHAGGFPNSVAPLGTALTERQMDLLWRMNEEPILCFDGDGAGLKAAYRAIDTVLPGLQPGRSVRFAMLPEGMDPDDLLRERGPVAMREVIDGALPLSQMIWNRETASVRADTPEKRAELERNLKQAIGGVRDESVRRHYLQNIDQRLNDLFAPQAKPSGGRIDGGRGAGNGFSGQRGRNGLGAGNRKARDGRTAGLGRGFAASTSLLNSSLIKRHSGLPALREATLVMGVLFHPAISVEMFGEFSSLQLDNVIARQVHGAILDGLSQWAENDEQVSVEFLVSHVRAKGQGDAMDRMEQMLRHNRIWQALPEAAFEDALDGWKQAFYLQLRNNTLNRELEAAQRALAEDDSQENLDRLLQIRTELESSEGTDALIDGFGLSSGRPVKSF